MKVISLQAALIVLQDLMLLVLRLLHTHLLDLMTYALAVSMAVDGWYMQTVVIILAVIAANDLPYVM